MIQSSSISRLEFFSEALKRIPYLRFLFSGLLMPLSFAPFHLPGLALLSLALFYHALSKEEVERPFFSGLVFGIGFFGLGISWIYISIHEYGHLHGVIAAFITFLFLTYLSLFPALIATFFCHLKIHSYTLSSAILFSSLWVLSEYLRSTFLSGFPWLLVGVGQLDTPLKFLLPIIGTFGVGLITCFAAALLSHSTQIKGPKRYACLIIIVVLFLFPLAFKNTKWSEKSGPGISVGIIQANLSMRDKWDETLFWQLLQRYNNAAKELLGTDLIVLPESAIPLPRSYISDFLEELDYQGNKAGSAILLGIPEPTSKREEYYFNALISLGKAQGSYFKQHLVPFGEYVPQPFQWLSDWLGIPNANLTSGKKNQSLVKIHHHPIASLICYELAYGNLLRSQLPTAEWIVSISDDGWFGHSFAMYQQLQMAQVLSLESARFQVVANNDGLSSVIDAQGNIIASLEAYSSGTLKTTLFPSTGQTPWVFYGDFPILFIVMIIIGISIIFKGLLVKDSHKPIAERHKRRYPYQPH